MKILLCGGGTGGHFYPLIGVAQALHAEAKKQKLIQPELYYMAPEEYDARALFENDIRFVKNGAGKIRRYFSFLNFLDIFRLGWGIITALYRVYKIYPDVVFSKGAYPSVPVVLAARILSIPIIIHDSDSKPGRANAWAGKFARRIAVSYPEAAQYFPSDKVAFTGNPIRKELQEPLSVGAFDYLKLDPAIPTIFIIGGSLGSQAINQAVLDSLVELVKDYQIVHQTGKNNFDEVKKLASVVLNHSEHMNRYRAYPTLNSLEMRMAAGACRIVVSRAGSTIFEIAAWGKPSIIIPIPEAISHDQTSNAFSYARSGGASVIEQNNLSSHILTSEINRIVKNTEIWTRMAEGAKSFARLDAAELIAREILTIALAHEE